ncbi:flagellar protein FliT [Paraburkholderia unamae]|uniref:Flagellar protein FliT n=1 Tax=Paraburkholderia unamae TaxID=219649 RepID=A0ABX5KYG3_9BURK|nr:flagellar protein FliT [Paraburkholderia unamae]PVX97438.1 protein FliT [Paraburkholderia unamae]RAR66725.1 protein FliT [Paraburkholderia unamae]CAG9274066.1 Protein FliT [Paraburkholderia unamae]
MQNVAPIEHIWSMTKDLEQAVAVGEWERAAQLADARSPLLASLGAQPPQEVMARLRSIYEIDNRIVEVARAARQALGAEYQSNMQASRNAGQYLSMARR